MIEGDHGGFYYVVASGTIRVFAAKGIGRVLKVYPLNEAVAERDIHLLARAQIDRDSETLHQINRELN